AVAFLFLLASPMPADAQDCADSTSDAAARLVQAVDSAARAEPPPAEVIRIQVVVDPVAFDDLKDDTVWFGPDGTLKGDGGVRPYVRSYDSIRAGPLR